MGVSMHRLLDISLEKGTVVVDTSPANFVHAATRDRSMVLSLAAFPYAALLQLRRWSATGSIRFKLSTPADVEDRDVFDANRLEAESSGVLKLLAEAPRHGVVIDGRDRLMQALYISGVIEAVEDSVGAWRLSASGKGLVHLGVELAERRHFRCMAFVHSDLSVCSL